MNNKIFYKIISYITDVLFGTGNNFVRFIPEYKIMESRFHASTAFLDFRQAGTDTAKCLYRPVARNGI